MKAKIERIDPKKRLVRTDQGEINYETVVVALGSTMNYFGVPGAARHTYHVRTLAAAMRLQRDVIAALERCSTQDLTVTIVGGAYTGVELAGQFSDLMWRDVKKLYPGVNVRLRLVQSGPVLLPDLPERVQRVAREKLAAEGVEILVNSRASEVRPHLLVLADGRQLTSDFIVWTAGFANIAECFLEKQHCERGRVPVNQHLHHTRFPSLYAVGDIALVMDPQSGAHYPQLGEAAHKEGQYAARHIVAAILGRSRRPFRFRSAGTFLPLGSWFGVAIIGRIVFFGRLAWFIRRTAYVLFLPGAMRKVKIIIDWTLHRMSHRYVVDIGENQL